MTPQIKRLTAGIAATLIVGGNLSPAYADDATTAGIVGALGLTADSGKTTLGDGAGSIEASLIQTEALNKAGWVIAKLVQSADSANTVVLMSKTDAIDLSAVQSMQLNIATLAANFPANGKDGKPVIPCVDPVAKPKGGGAGKGGGKMKDMAVIPGVTGASAIASIPSILATDTSIAKVEVDEDDRVLIEAIMMNEGVTGQASKWQAATGDVTATRTGPAAPTFVLPSESIQATTTGSPLYRAFTDLRQKVADAQKCTNATWKSASTAATAFITTATTVGDKGAASPLTIALEQEAFTKAGNDVLRVAIESTGGTSITRQGVLYTLGFPNAAMVSSGLVVSFRLMNPADGRAKLTGFVRCSAKPINFKKVQAALDANQEGVDCSYLANGPAAAAKHAG